MRNQLLNTVAFYATDDAAQSGTTTADVQAHADKLAAEATATAQAKLAKANAKRAASKLAAKQPKQPTKPTGKQAVVVSGKPSKPTVAKPAAPSADQQARAKLTDADIVAARRFYDGASLAVHSRKPCKRSDYIARTLNPVQRADNPTTRDESALALILSRSNGGGIFDPCAGSGLDLGAVSRASSLGFIRYDAKADTFTLTTSGIERARAILKRFAPAKPARVTKQAAA